jgi:hypothetical protein
MTYHDGPPISPTMTLPPRIGDEGEESSLAWQEGFELFTASGGMTCNICACLVRQVPGHAQRHRAWHRRLGDC